MDIFDIGAAVALAQHTAGSAAQRAEEAAATALQHGYGFSVSGHTLMITAPEDRWSFQLVAPLYEEKTYVKGQIVLYDGKLWQAGQDINAVEQWTAAHWNEVTISEIYEAIIPSIDSENHKVKFGISPE